MKKDLDDTKIFSDKLIDVIENKREEKEIHNLREKWIKMKENIYSNRKNINPLSEMPESQMRLYGFKGIFASAYFDTEEELIEYAKTNNIQFGDFCIIDYLGNVAGFSNVIKLTYQSGKEILYSAWDEYGYKQYNPEKSFYKGEFVWEYQHGRINQMYSAFKNRGIVFENDIHAKIDEDSQKSMEWEEFSNDNSDFDAIAVPCNRAFIVSVDNAEDFKKAKPNPILNEQIKKATDKLQIKSSEPRLTKNRNLKK